MKSKASIFQSAGLALAILLLGAAAAFACTTMIVTKGATVDGSMLVAHSDDDELGDQRMLRVPARKQVGERQIFHESYRYPRIVTDQRGPGYNTEGYPATKPLYMLPYTEIFNILGYEVPVSYAYYDGNYGIMNEHNLMLGECTNAANFQPASNGDAKNGRLRIFYSSELSRIALENCKTAREAIKLMGGLIDKFGYYSTGETLLVADKDEAWVFEMCALPDSKYHSAWVAKRVPDGMMFVAANEFRIREVIKNDPDNFMYSPNLLPGLKKLGWWDEKKQGAVDWLKAVSPGEYNHPYYSLRRVWRVQDRVAPSLGLSPWADGTYTTQYPFAVKPDRKLTLREVFSLYRDHYEGTQFDLTKGTAAGPFGDPHRFVGPYDGNQNNISKGKTMYGAWERAISVFYQGYTFVCQWRPNAPEATKGAVWFGPDVSYTTVFTPFYSKALKLHPAYSKGSPQKLDRQSAWWAFNYVNNWSRLNFQLMTRADILPLQTELELGSIREMDAVDARVAAMSADDAILYITESGAAMAENVLTRWWALGDRLVAKYSDGYINLPDGDYADTDVEKPVMLGYPADWLKKTNYADGPTTYEMMK